MTPINKFQSHFFFTLLIGALVLTFFVFLPYVSSLVLAMVFAVLFYPIHRRIRAKVAMGNENSSYAAFVTLFVIVCLVLTPLLIIAAQVSFEARDLYTHLTSQGGGIPLIDSLSYSLNVALERFFPSNSELISLESIDFNQYVQQGLHWAFTNIDALFSKAARLLFDLFIFILALYYMLRDGSKLKRQIINYSPLLDVYDEQIFKKLEGAINSVIKGSLTVGLIQGVLTGIGFSIFGIPNPALWGCFAVIAALIPGIGTALVLIPGILYLIVIGHFPHAIGLVVWSALAVGLIDNFLGPLFIKKGIHIHQFLILLSVMGGLVFFGPIGFILGPLVLSLLFALLEIYKTSILKSEVVTTN